MKNSKCKRLLALMLSVLMMFAMLPTALFATAAEEDCPVMQVYNVSSAGDYHAVAYYSKVYSVTFLGYIDNNAIASADTVASWDVSYNGDGSVMAWAQKNEVETVAAGADRYDIYVGGEGGVQAHEDTTHMFYAFQKLEVVSGLENFHTGKVKSFKDWFSNCSSLETLDLGALDTSSATSMKNLFYNCKMLQYVSLHGWDTSNVTDMSYMFYNCVALKEVDLRSFDTSKVTTMYFMFYRAGELTNIYIGSGWTNESIANLNESVFNCCYAIRGGKDEYDKNPQETAYYAVAKPEGNLEIRLKVEYEFTGDVPEGVEAPNTLYYEKNENVSVEAAPEVPDGYTFSGWSTDDVTVTDGEFTLTDDVLFTGEWSRAYNVYYVYTGEVPAEAPEVPATKAYKAGENILVSDAPQVQGYAFVGWTTQDVVTTGGDFIMPEKDVTLYGYFKKPVSGVVINTGNVTLNESDEIKLEITVNPEDATIKDVLYESGDENVVIVDDNGNIKAVGEGTTTITVSSKDDPTKKDTITVTVKKPVSEVVLEKEKTILYINETEQLNVTVNPDDATNKKLIWESGDDSIVTVDENGNITAVGDGTTTITVTSEDEPTKKDSIIVKVNIPVEDIVIENEDTEIAIGEELQLNVTVNPDTASVKELEYTSDNENVVKVDEYGKVTPVGEGTATITVTSKDNPDITETITITVVMYKVTYEFIGDVIPDSVKAPDGGKYNSGEEATVEADSAAEGYIFSGWSTKDNADIKDGKFNIYNDVHFVGSWEKIINYYDVTYKYEGEVPANAPEVPTEKTYEEGTTVTVEATLTLDGYIFTGWETKDVTVADGKFDIYNDVEFVGKWEKIVNYYDVTYKYEGNVPTNAPEVPTEKTYEEGSTVTVEANPTLDGYIFTGWETKDVTVADGKFDIYNDVEFVGKWEKIINYYKVTYKYKGDIPVNVPELPAEKTYEEGSEVTVAAVPSFIGYEFSGWTTTDANISDGKFSINNDVVIVGRWTMMPGAATSIVVPKDFTMVLGEEAILEAYVNGSASNKKLNYTVEEGSSVVELDADGNVKAIGAGKAKIKISSAANPAIYGFVVITVYADSAYDTKHYIVFGRTEHIGWYNVSLDGGKSFFPVYGNSHLEVEHGTEVIIKARDLVGDPFTFYVNGKAMTPDENGYVRVVADKYLLIGALGIPVEAPDVDESMSLIQRIVKAIKDFFAMIAGWFKF
ncbi:MAG: Ig-like domain-containing protein [Clostridia bacterium]|nr:Ig-like domain-containing protein [Clostridia bacterium]